MSKSVILAAGEKINPLVPHTAELIVGTIAFTLLFLVLRSKVVPMFEKALKNFALKLRKKQHALLQLHTHPLRQSVNKQ